MEETESSETSAQEIQTPWNHRKERIQVLALLMTHVFWDLLLFCVILEKIVDILRVSRFQVTGDSGSKILPKAAIL
jgi:hypothetical protein